jgi:L-rhamnose-H+ transport protein
VPELFRVLATAPRDAVLWSYTFGVLWGIGGLTFGLSMRYLGISLGYAVALGFCAALGTLIPPIFSGAIIGMLADLSGQVVLAGVGVCLAGIGVCGRAGICKELELPAEGKTETIAEFNFVRGVWVAMLAGIMSACMAFGIAAGKPIAELAVQSGTRELWRNTAVFVVILAGGFTTNCVWCVYLNWKNGTARDYLSHADAPLLANYLLSGLAGVTWYLQFMFYGMGTTQMGRYDFASWTLHMAFIIVFSNVWGLALREWKGCSPRTLWWIAAGLLTLIASTIVIGYGNMLAG